MNAQLFYKDSINIIYSISQNNVDRYFLTIPVNQYTNFMTFLKLKKEDNTKKGISEYSDERIKRKEFLNELTKANQFFETLNKNMVYSRVNHLKELPIKELEDILDERKPFDMNKYKEISQKIENIINENFKLMTSPNIKKESIEQTISLISPQEDPEFIEWLKEHLETENNNKNLEDLRMEFKKQTIQLNIEEYKEITTNGKKFIIGKNTSGETFSVQIPLSFNMRQVFETELKTIDKSKLVNLDNKLVARLLFEKIILDLPSERLVKTHEEEQNKEENKDEQSLLNNEIYENKDNYLVDKNNNIAINTVDENNVITIERNDNGQLVANDAQVSTYNFNENTHQPEQTETIVQSKGKRRVLVPSNRIPNGQSGFIKTGTIVLFGLSFILTTISLILLISS